MLSTIVPILRDVSQLVLWVCCRHFPALFAWRFPSVTKEIPKLHYAQ